MTLGLLCCLSFALVARADDASSAPDQTQTDTPPPGDATVTTGDAAAQSDTQNSVNTNDTTVPGDASVADGNTASTTNDTSAAADTGGNTAAAGGGSASVSTGSAFASANVINVINTNLINSSGLLAFLNLFFTGGGISLDSPAINALFGGGSAGCSFEDCDSGTLNVSNDNTATTTNTTVVEASTGGNTAAAGGDAAVSTGDAAASANVVNVINTNLIDSHYLLVALNNFGNLGGDITLPGAAFFEQLMAGQGGTGGSVSNSNTATVNNTTSAAADTGGNTASSTGGGASVTTGAALSQATTFNQVNTNLTGGSTVFMLVNIMGNWSGTVEGLPPGLTWAPTPTGIAIMGTGAGGDPSQVLADNNNTANVDNHVQVYALTGANESSSAGGDASVTTGNAYASANVVNLVNTNVIGENWMLAIFNVFGNWDGNLAFGHPDLWIGGVAQTDNPTPPGSEVVYDFTVSNRGDADATNVVLSADYDTHMLTFVSPSATTTGGVSWNLGDIPAGQTREFTYTAQAGLSDGAVPLAATVTEDGTDANPADNTENLTINIGYGNSNGGGHFIGAYEPEPKLTITKTQSTYATTAPATVDYTVTVDNDPNAGPAYLTTLSDSLTDPSGAVIYSNSWSLDTIEPGDEIKLTYSIEYGTSSVPGLYTDTSSLDGYKNYDTLPYANPLDQLSTSTALSLGGVLGASTDVPSVALACGPFITQYLGPGRHNDPAQVKLLQYFLHTFEGAAVGHSGVYDAATQAAVASFQQKYAGDVLSPWGLSDPSGSVYYLTQQKINELYCQGRSEFPLSNTQTSEILSYRATHSYASTVAGDTAPKALSNYFKFTLPPQPTQAGAPVSAPAHEAQAPAKDLLSQLGRFFGSYIVWDVPQAQASGTIR